MLPVVPAAAKNEKPCLSIVQLSSATKELSVQILSTPPFGLDRPGLSPSNKSLGRRLLQLEPYTVERLREIVGDSFDPIIPCGKDVVDKF